MKMVLRMKKIYEKSVINLTQSGNRKGNRARNRNNSEKTAS